jgi:hypothetical protein
MSEHRCPNCGYASVDLAAIPPEPPIGTWVKDRHGAVSQRHKDAEGRVGWSPPGCYAFGKWEAKWAARGPLTVCGPWGAALPEEV